MLKEVHCRTLGATGLSVSTIAFGAWGIGGYPFWEEQDDAVSLDAIATAFGAGINFYDTAPVYGFGRSEELIGRALKGKRQSVVVATKCGLRWKKPEGAAIYKDLKPTSVREEVEASLRRLGTDYIDLYQVHWPSPDDPLEATLEAMVRLKEEGKIRAIGVSNFDLDLMKRAVALTEIGSLQPKYNLLEQDAGKDLLPFCGEHNVGVIVYSPLASGLLTGKYSSASSFSDWRGEGGFGIFRKETLGEAYRKVDRLKAASDAMDRSLAEVAINWVLANPHVTSALVGVKNADQMRSNVRCVDNPLTEKEKQDVDETF